MRNSNGVGILFRQGVLRNNECIWLTPLQWNYVTKWGMDNFHNYWASELTGRVIYGYDAGTTHVTDADIAIIGTNVVPNIGSSFEFDASMVGCRIVFANGAEYDIDSITSTTMASVSLFTVEEYDATQGSAKIILDISSVMQQPVIASTTCVTVSDAVANSKYVSVDGNSTTIRNTRIVEFPEVTEACTYSEIGWSPDLTTVDLSTVNVFGKQLIDAAYDVGDVPIVEVSVVRTFDTTKYNGVTSDVAGIDASVDYGLMLDHPTFDTSYYSTLSTTGVTIPPTVEDTLFEAKANGSNLLVLGDNTMDLTDPSIVSEINHSDIDYGSYGIDTIHAMRSFGDSIAIVYTSGSGALEGLYLDRNDGIFEVNEQTVIAPVPLTGEYTIGQAGHVFVLTDIGLYEYCVGWTDETTGDSAHLITSTVGDISMIESNLDGSRLLCIGATGIMELYVDVNLSLVTTDLQSINTSNITVVCGISNTQYAIGEATGKIVVLTSDGRVPGEYVINNGLDYGNILGLLGDYIVTEFAVDNANGYFVFQALSPTISSVILGTCEFNDERVYMRGSLTQTLTTPIYGVDEKYLYRIGNDQYVHNATSGKYYVDPENMAISLSLTTDPITDFCVMLEDDFYVANGSLFEHITTALITREFTDNGYSGHTRDRTANVALTDIGFDYLRSIGVTSSSVNVNQPMWGMVLSSGQAIQYGTLENLVFRSSWKRG